MEIAFFIVVIALFLLAIFDLFVGVSNDAVNFLNSAIGAKVASFYAIMAVAAVGVFVGASTSNGMMDIARHGIFQPEYFSLYDVMCIFLAVMITDVILLDIFNSLGMPTSTTVSMVFELLGGAFVLAVLKLAGDASLEMGQVLNTGKALTMIVGIFLSVAVAFFAGLLVQWLARLLFSFQYKRNMKWFGGLFGGLSVTSIAYFILIKGAKNMTFMTPEVQQWIADNTLLLVGGLLVVSTLVMQLLHWMRVNVLKIVVLAGTFSLALAFAGNDLVNFVGVPLAGYSAFSDFVAHGAGSGPREYMMNALNEPASTPLFFLLGAGAVMVISLLTSKKAHQVIKTSLDLSRQDSGDEMFGSSRVARELVRFVLTLSQDLRPMRSKRVKNWVDSRFNAQQADITEGASFDLIRASVNLVLAGLLIAVGTSLKLPLSTTYVTFMVAMGTSLADRAWPRESAVFRVTGVISVIGGWFLTAGVAFVACGLVVLLFYYGGLVAMYAMIALVVVLIVKNQITNRRAKTDRNDERFAVMMATENQADVWGFLSAHYAQTASEFVMEANRCYGQVVDGFVKEDVRALRKSAQQIELAKKQIKKLRRQQLLGLRRCEPMVALEKSAWFHLSYNSIEQMRYVLKRIMEPSKEHVDNNFNPLPEEWQGEYEVLRQKIDKVAQQMACMMKDADYTEYASVRTECEQLTERLSVLRDVQMDRLRQTKDNLHVTIVYLNLIQETQQYVSAMKHLLRASRRFVQ